MVVTFCCIGERCIFALTMFCLGATFVKTEMICVCWDMVPKLSVVCGNEKKAYLDPCFAALTASSARLFDCRYPIEYMRWWIPHCFRKVSKVDDVNWSPPSLDTSSGTPKGSKFGNCSKVVDFYPAAKPVNSYKLGLFLSFKIIGTYLLE